MPHLDFLEKIAEGFVIEAYNSTKERECDHMHDGLGFLHQHVAFTLAFERSLDKPPITFAMPQHERGSKWPDVLATSVAPLPSLDMSPLEHPPVAPHGLYSPQAGERVT